jgi:16S rRNA (cytosine967-C5)-methyltransferase
VTANPGRARGKRAPRRPPAAPADEGIGVAARRAAVDALVRIDESDAYANLLLPRFLDHSSLDKQGRALVTDLVYGVTRHRRACDFLVDRFLMGAVEPRVRAALRVGAFQLVVQGVPPHAAVSTTVSAAPARARGLVNAVLRKVATVPVVWPDDATRLSYPDWIIDTLRADLGDDAAIGALEAMNRPAAVTVRDDGYVQDLASQWVAATVPAGPGARVADVCSAPGGKATALAATGAFVAASDVRPGRLQLVDANRRTLDATALAVVAADARRAPYRDGAFDAVLVDAPCSGLGALGRRPDARWRIDADAPARLRDLQVAIVAEAARLVRPGGVVVYSVCTLTSAESLDVLDAVEAAVPSLRVDDEPPPAPWTPVERDGRVRGGRVLPQDHGTDGMFVARLRRLP